MLAPGRKLGRRHGAAAVEFAVLVPFLAFIFLIAVDFSRVFYSYLTVADCARNGALYASDQAAACQSPYPNVQQAALADASNLNPTPTVTSGTGTDSSGDYAEVTVTYQFSTITTIPYVARPLTVTRTVRMRMAPSAGCPP